MSNKLYSFKLLINGPESFTTEYQIPIGITTIGREPDNLLQLDDRTISRYHARIECVSDECSITDLGSSNGTYVNNVKVSVKVPIPLNNMDRIQLGPKYEMVISHTEIKEEEVFIEEPAQFSHHEPVEPPIPPPPQPPYTQTLDGAGDNIPSWLMVPSRHLLNYLPEIYHTDFMENFLGIFEVIQMPIIWTIDNFDLFLSPRTAPSAFLPWLSNWFEAEFDNTWSEPQRRQFLQESWLLYARRGTKWSLTRILEIYTGESPIIDDLAEDLRPHAFRVTIPVKEASINRASVEILINQYKPAHTDYELHFQR